MGEAMLSAILARGLSSPEAITVSDVIQTRRQHLEQKYGVVVAGENRQALEEREVVVLAVKPQNLAEVMTGLNGQLKPEQLVLSIIAGKTIQTLASGLNHSRIVRAMPNTPAQIGQGMTVWIATTEVSESQKGWVRSILGAIGQEIYVTEEKYLDMATAVSGSGPAYFFLFVETLTEAGVQLGLSRKVAEELVLQTMLGSGGLIQQSGKPPAELRRMVTSPGGTTAEAILRLEQGGFGRLVKQAVTAAYNRAQELGK